MYDAPSVEYPVGRCVFARRLLMTLTAAWVLVQLGWWWSGVPQWPNGAWWFSAAMGIVLLAWWGWRSRHSVEGSLAWEAGRQGEQRGHWIWRSGAYRRSTLLAQVEWVLDAQGAALLRLTEPGGRTQWVWVEQRAAPPLWDDLRRALQAHRLRLGH